MFEIGDKVKVKNMTSNEIIEKLLEYHKDRDLMEIIAIPRADIINNDEHVIIDIDNNYFGTRTTPKKPLISYLIGLSRYYLPEFMLYKDTYNINENINLVSCPICGKLGEDLVFSFYCSNSNCQNWRRK